MKKAVRNFLTGKVENPTLKTIKLASNPKEVKRVDNIIAGIKKRYLKA